VDDRGDEVRSFRVQPGPSRGRTVERRGCDARAGLRDRQPQLRRVQRGRGGVGAGEIAVLVDPCSEHHAEPGFGERALVIQEDAVKGLEKLDTRFDVCFIDLLNVFPSEDVTRRALELCIEHLDGGALLMADNALRQGEVVRPKNQQAKNVAYYNQLVAKHPRLESVVVPIRDGLSIARVKD